VTAFFRIVGPIDAAETIAEGRGIQELGRLTKAYGPGNWRKRKGFAEVRFADGSTGRAEVHWYEAHGIGKREFKLKRLMDG
jgi:hypothetical protein